MKVIVYLMLNSMRLVTKDCFSVADHIQHKGVEQMKSLFNVAIPHAPATKIFCPPHFKFLVGLKDAINKGPEAGRHFSLLGYTGLGAIHWFEKACIYKNLERKVYTM